MTTGLPASTRAPEATGTAASKGVSLDAGWLLLTYRIPSEPSRLRAGVWRKLKSNGAIYLQNSVAALPDRPPHERLLRGLRAEITELGGTAQLFRAAALTGGGDVLAAYNAARDDEYEEFLDKCQDFLAEIARETAVGHTTFGELEENDEDLSKLRRWLAKISERDVLAASRAAEAVTPIERCAAALEEFAQRVYGADPDAG